MTILYKKRRSDALDEGFLAAEEGEFHPYDKSHKKDVTSANTKFLILVICIFICSALLLSINFSLKEDMKVIRHILAGEPVDESDSIIDKSNTDAEGREYVKKVFKSLLNSINISLNIR